MQQQQRLIKRAARSLEERLDDIQDYVVEQLAIVKALATSQAIAVEQQAQALTLQHVADNMLRKANVSLVSVIKTTDTILGITKRTEALVSAASRRDYWSFATFTLDPWACLYAYMLLHPIAPRIAEQIASIWQFVLITYRISDVFRDILLSAKQLTSLSGLVSVYLTSPYKAIYYLYWLNRSFVLIAEHTALTTLSITIALPTCSMHVTPAALVCLADYTVTTIGTTLLSVKDCVTHSEIFVQISILWALEMAIWYGALKKILSFLIKLLLPARLKYLF
jgi:hypothetical protein